MRHYSLTALLLVLVSIATQAKVLQPVYFDDPSIDLQSPTLSPEQRSFYDRYVHAIEQMEQGADAAEFFILEHGEEEDKVEPLLGNIKYDQGAPYNNKCPYLNGGRAVTGCVATAMAQVMRYYKYPACGTGTFTYTGGDEGARTVNLEDYPFDWDNMLEDYSGSYTSTQADAVATLMLMCGASLSMNYSKDGSGADLGKMDGLLKNNFGYNKNVHFISTKSSSNPEETIYYWGEDAVRPNLQVGRPLIFAGFPAINQTGHCFVVDGYKVIDGEYYYHVNWGWGGHGNSYCLLTRLQYESDNYSGYNLQMVYDIYPASQDIEAVSSDEVRSQKILRDGHLIIERNNVQYTPQGIRIQ